MKREKIEQKAKELMWCVLKEHTWDEKKQIEECAIMMADWALSHQWVSVEDELPKVGELVLTTFIDYKGKRRYATGENTGAGMQVYGVISPSPFPPVTHWMPIPPLVEEGGEK